MNIMIVDDDKAILFALSELFSGDAVFTALSGEEALRILETQVVDVAVIDYQLPGMNGLVLLAEIKKKYSSIECIMMTAHSSEKIAIEAIRAGAYDYVAKPFDNVELIHKIGHIRESVGMRKCSYDERFYFSPVMMQIIEKCKKAAVTGIPVLLTGETGTGKDVLSELIHNHSGVTGRYIAVNCGALPSSVIENELFGSEKGAYTGSVRVHQGLFEQADNGTLFLDEIGEMPIDMQAKLLRVLQDGDITRIGGVSSIQVKVRIIAATNRNLIDEIREGRFREDLYYRLSVVTIQLPPLRKRKEEIKPLSYFFLMQFASKYAKNITMFEDVLMERMCSYSWPGNIRELKNKIEQSVIFSDHATIGSKDLALEAGECTEPDMSGSGWAFPFEELGTNLKAAKKEVLHVFERQFITLHLQKNKGIVSKTAEDLGIYRQELYRLLKELGIDE